MPWTRRIPSRRLRPLCRPRRRAVPCPWRILPSSCASCASRPAPIESPSAMADLTPGRIDRAALDRIMQRAAELQASEADVGEGLTSEEVLALGRDVGIPGRYLQQAMLEQATAIVTRAEAGFSGRLVGPAQVTAHRVVLGDPEDAARALVTWFDGNELLVVLRQQPGRVTFEPLSGMQAALRRGSAAFSSSKPKYMLARAPLVTATFNKLETGYCHVTLTADLHKA